MKTRIFLLMLIAVALFSCQKEKNDPATTQDVTFTATQIDPGAGLKGTADWDWKCIANLNPDYAEIKIYDAGGTVLIGTFYPQVFRLSGKLYTQAIKLAPGTYTVDQFLVKDDIGPAGPDAGDPIYMAIPAAGALYSQYTNPDVRFQFTVLAFQKLEIPVEVLCFIPAEYTGFGFDWFVITEIIVREMCFFGDLCLNGNGGVYPAWVPSDYAGSLYDANGTQEDEVAIFKVKVFRDGSLISESNNEAWYGIGQPLCVQYPDKLGVIEVFTFEIWVYVKSLSGFGYQWYHSFTKIDGEAWVTGPDGVVDFVVGTCSPDSQYIWPWITPLP